MCVVKFLLHTPTHNPNITNPIHSHVIPLSETLKGMEIFTRFGLKRLRWITENLEDNVFDWKMTNQSNSIRWVLSHIAIILNVYFPRAITGDLKYYPQELPLKYLDNPSLYTTDTE